MKRIAVYAVVATALLRADFTLTETSQTAIGDDMKKFMPLPLWLGSASLRPPEPFTKATAPPTSELR